MTYPNRGGYQPTGDGPKSPPPGGNFGTTSVQVAVNATTHGSVPADGKASNPKDAISNGKVPLHLVPFTATMGAAIGLLHGALKYGRMNWRKAGIRATVYLDAIERHLQDYRDGNDTDEDGCDNLFAILANVSILVDARAAGKMADDRNVRGADFTAFKKQMESEVARLKAMHAGKNPKHYTIADNKDSNNV